MINIAKLSAKERSALFTNTAAKTGMTDAIIEKDFWVCWTLDYLFNHCEWKNHLAFKGGTSLSKAFHLIKRFSEDIDLILDWRVLDYTAEEPWMERSNTKQDQFNKEANVRAVDFLREEFLPVVQSGLSQTLGFSIHLSQDADDGQTVLFTYPQEFSDSSILQEIRLEIGALAAWTPAEKFNITPYAAEQYPHLFAQPDTTVLTVLPERTFWEKILILHREANRPEKSAFPQRYSRHYFDLYCMADSAAKDAAFANLGLLAKVTEFKEKFYRSSWAEYEKAKPGTIKLMPPNHKLTSLATDYEHMQNMIFGRKPDFETLMEGIKHLEDEINHLRN